MVKLNIGEVSLATW